MALDWKTLVGLSKSPDTTSLGPDFPESAGDREKGKFRESTYPRLTTLAVSNDDGGDIGAANLSVEEETALYLKAIALGMSLLVERDLIKDALSD